MYVKYLRTQT